MSTRQKLPPRVPIQSSDECQLNLTHVPWNPQINGQHSNTLAQPLLFSNLKKGLLNFPNPSVLKLFVSSKFTGVHLSGGNQIQPFRNFWRTVARNPSLPRTPKKRGGRKKKVEQEKRGWCDFLALKTKTDFFKKGIEAKKREHGKVKEVSSSSPHLGAWKMPLAILSPHKESCMVALEIPLKPNEINS